MTAFHKIGVHTIAILSSGVLFLRFLGHFCVDLKNIALRRAHVPWFNIWEVLYLSGAKLVLPLLFISCTTGIALTLTINNLLARYDLQKKVLIIAVQMLAIDFVPLVIGSVFCIQAALNLIRTQANKLHKLSPSTASEYLVPIMVGINIAALLMYAYLFIACVGSIYFTAHYFLHYNVQEYVLRFMQVLTFSDLALSLLKTLCYCTIVSLTTGYYYYEVAIFDIAVRRAVSRIITRGIFWIVLCGFYFKLFGTMPVTY